MRWRQNARVTSYPIARLEILVDLCVRCYGSQSFGGVHTTDTAQRAPTKLPCPGDGTQPSREIRSSRMMAQQACSTQDSASLGLSFCCSGCRGLLAVGEAERDLRLEASLTKSPDMPLGCAIMPSRRMSMEGMRILIWSGAACQHVFQMARERGGVAGVWGWFPAVRHAYP